MALSFTEGSIGGDIERVNLNQLQAFYGKNSAVAQAAPAEVPIAEPEPTGSNGMAIAPSNTAGHHALLLINPHTSFFFRSELQMVSERGPRTPTAPSPGDSSSSIRASTSMPAGCTPRAASTPSTSTWKPSQKKGDRYFYKYGNEERPVTATEITVPYKTDHGMAEKKFTVYRTPSRPDRPRSRTASGSASA